MAKFISIDPRQKEKIRKLPTLLKAQHSASVNLQGVIKYLCAREIYCRGGELKCDLTSLLFKKVTNEEMPSIALKSALSASNCTYKIVAIGETSPNSDMTFGRMVISVCVCGEGGI